MRIFNYNATLKSLPYPLVVQEIEDLLFECHHPEIQIPRRLHIPLIEGGVLLVMPACDSQIGMTKLVTVHPNNSQHQLPSVQGDVLVFESSTGRRLGILDGPAVTEVRTAALTVLAAQRLAPRPEGDLLIVGSGVQAAAHVTAFSEVLKTRRVYVYSRTLANAISFCQQHQQNQLEMIPAENLEEVLNKVSLIVTATTSPKPVLPAGISSGQFVAAVGSYRPDMQELPDDLIRRATSSDSLLVVDTEAALEESGEFLSLKGNHTRVQTLADAIKRQTEPSELISKGIVVFKSVGHAMWDLAAVRTWHKSLAVD